MRCCMVIVMHYLKIFYLIDKANCEADLEFLAS